MYDDRFRILAVCTGNICRSPMMQAMLVDGLRRELGERAAMFEVTSAGTYGLTGSPMEPDAVRVLGDLQVAIDPFVARELVLQLVESSDLIVTATREHRAVAVTMLPRAWKRTFTVRELARLIGAVDLGRAEGRTPIERARWLVAAASGQRGYVPAQAPSDDDVADPYGRRPDAYRRAADEIKAALDVVVPALVTVVEAPASEALAGESP